LAVVIRGYPIASSSDDSSGVPQTRQITDEQSPQVSGSSTGFAQCGQYKVTGCGFGSWAMISFSEFSTVTLAAVILALLTALRGAP
jgi:hypothetical protein